MAYFTPAELTAMQLAAVSPPVVSPEMLAYCRLRYALIFAGFLYSVCTLLFLLNTGLAAKLSVFCSRLNRYKLIQLPLFCILLALSIALIRFPFSFYATYFVDHAYGLSHQSFGGWLVDLLKGKAVDACLMALGFTIAFAIIDRFKKYWTLLLWAVLAPLIAVGIFLAPLLIDPIFNRFVEMGPGPLRTQIQNVASRAGIPNAPIFVVDKSKQTTKLNAYVTGLGSSARIVIWDNMLQKMPPDQVQAVVAHETGHYVLGHIVLGFALVSAGLFALLQGISKWGNWLVAKLPTRWSVRGITDLTAVPAVMLIATLASFIFSPVDNAISRAMEHQADEFGLKVTSNGPAMARAFVSLSQENLSEPAPPLLIQFWFFSHPSLHDRILFALGLR